MASTVEKVAISVDRDLLRRAERARLITGETRSALMSRALERLLASEERQRRIGEYVSAYQARPETDDELETAHLLATRSVKSLPWTDP